MTVSGLTVADLQNYLHIDDSDVDAAEENILTACLEAAKNHVGDYTGLDVQGMDKHANLAIAVLCVAGDMYTNRDMMSTAKGGENLTAKSIMDMYSMNLLPNEE